MTQNYLSQLNVDLEGKNIGYPMIIQELIVK